MQDNNPHIPVLLQQVVNESSLEKGGSVIDGTIGFGGHASALLKIIGTTGKYLGIDKDVTAVNYCKNHLDHPGLIVAEGLLSNIDAIAKEKGFEGVDFILFDLGVSSPQLDEAGYGISYSHDGPLDMRIGKNGLSAYEIINNWKPADLKRLFTENGQEATNRLVDKIVAARQKDRIQTIFQLRALIESVVPFKKGINPSTQVFQALRISANEELAELQLGLEKSIKLLRTGGRIAVISFHSGEDKIVKKFFKKESIDCICPVELPICQCSHRAKLRIITKNPIAAEESEIKSNPRSRSAKLRIAEKV